jgi:hypothetical protein
VATIDKPATHHGKFLPPRIYCSILLPLPLAKDNPITKVISIYKMMTIISESESSMFRIQINKNGLKK